MPASDEQGGGAGRGRSSRVVAFWTSLPGVLTGLAAVITAVATLAAVDFGGGGDDPAPVAPSGGSTSIANSGSDEPECLSRYFAGVPADRTHPVEAGTVDFDVIAADQPKAGTIGLRFAKDGASIGAMRIAFFPANALFKIESVVDRRCSPIEDYANVSRGGDRRVLQNADTVRLRLGGDFYDLRINASTTIRLSFEAYVP